MVIIDTPEGPIRIMVTRFEGKRVVLGIDAPRCYRILRAELSKQGGLE